MYIFYELLSLDRYYFFILAASDALLQINTNAAEKMNVNIGIMYAEKCK